METAMVALIVIAVLVAVIVCFALFQRRPLTLDVQTPHGHVTLVAGDCPLNAAASTGGASLDRS